MYYSFRIHSTDQFQSVLQWPTNDVRVIVSAHPYCGDDLSRACPWSSDLSHVTYAPKHN